MSQNKIVAVFFIALLLFILYQVLWILSPFARPIFWAAILTFGFYPVHLKVKSFFKKEENIPAVITSLIIFATFVPLVVFIIAGLVTEVFRFSDWASGFIRSGELEQALVTLSSHPIVAKVKDALFRWEYIRDHARLWAENLAGAATNLAAKHAFNLTKSVVVAPFEFLLILFLVFFFLKDGPKIYQFFYEATPMEEPDKKVVFRQINHTFEAVIRGQLLTALIQSSIAGIVYWSLGVPLPIFFAAVTFLATLIPISGAAAVWMPLTLYFVFIHAYAKAVILLLLGTFVISLMDNVLKPILIGKKAKLPYLLLLLGILGGMEAYGLVGMFLAPVVLSLFFSLVTIYREKFLN